MNVPGAYELIQLEETLFDAPIAGRLFNRVAAVVNEALSIAQSSAIGSVELSLLTETQFQAQKGDGWVLMDGRSVVGSGYATAFSLTNIPDFRGLFIRGKNNGSTNDFQGEFATGHVNATSNNRVHTHPVTLSIQQFPSGSTFFTFWNTQITMGGGGATQYHGAPSFELAAIPGQFQILPAGVLEARPRNITVNYFIKIN
jgi:hypothetical protein